jgi:hypothetical protein
MFNCEIFLDNTKSANKFKVANLHGGDNLEFKVDLTLKN